MNGDGNGEGVDNVFNYLEKVGDFWGKLEV